MSSIIQTLDLKNVVIISPSMSGSYSIDFLLTHHKSISGFVPVSPVNTYVLDKSLCEAGVNYTALDRDCRKVLPYIKRTIPVLSCIKVSML